VSQYSDRIFDLCDSQVVGLNVTSSFSNPTSNIKLKCNRTPYDPLGKTSLKRIKA
jgi:hypothetical protein